MNETIKGAVDIINTNIELYKLGYSREQVLNYWESVGAMVRNFSGGNEEIQNLEYKLNELIDIISILNKKIIKLEEKRG